MATINYVTLKLPKILWLETEVIQETPNFEVRKYLHKKGVIFRLPYGLKKDDVCHAFLEHEINLSNTIRTGTLTIKIQVTFIPCHIGVFSGFNILKGSYQCDYDDEYGSEEYFKPNYNHSENIKNIVPLPPNIKTNLSKFLDEILFKYTDNADLIDKYAVDLGCQKKNIKFLTTPKQTSDTSRGAKVFHETIDFFNEITSGNLNLLPESE